MPEDKDSPRSEGKTLTKGQILSLYLKPLANVQTSIGQLYLFPLRVSDIDSYKSISADEPVSRIREFLPFIASLSCDDKQKKERVEIPVEQVGQLSDAEVEVLAEAYASSSDFVQAREGGKGREPLAQNQCEPATSFLDRLLREKIEEEASQMSKLREKILGSTSSIFDQVRKSNLELEKTWKSFKNLSMAIEVPPIETTKSLETHKHFAQDLEADRHIAEYSAIADIEKVLRRDQEIMQALDPFRDMRRLVESNAAFDSVLTNLKCEQELIQSVSRQFEREKHHIEEISRTSILAMSIYHNNDLIDQIAREETQVKAMSASIAADIAKQQQVTSQLIGQHEMLFRLPRQLEVSHLLDDYSLGAVAKLVQQQQSAFILDHQQFVDAISTPWLNSIESARSVSAILELQSIGNALLTMKGFEPGFTVALRKDLGDWRDKITFPEVGLIDPVTRTEFYIDRGFNSALTDFPYAAFQQGLNLAGLGDASLDLELYGAVAPQSENAEEAGLRRTNRCHDRLQRFERQLRQFIDKEMTVQYGPNWPKKRLTPKIYESWEFKKQKAENNGITLSFIDVADFTDYEAIICKQDHWRELFARRFKRKESVRESLQRLQPIRLTTMHARIVTKEDELYLVAEIIRLIRAIN